MVLGFSRFGHIFSFIPDSYYAIARKINSQTHMVSLHLFRRLGGALPGTELSPRDQRRIQPENPLTAAAQPPTLPIRPRDEEIPMKPIRRNHSFPLPWSVMRYFIMYSCFVPSQGLWCLQDHHSIYHFCQTFIFPFYPKVDRTNIFVCVFILGVKRKSQASRGDRLENTHCPGGKNIIYTQYILYI